MKPKLFIGSSSESLDVANAIQENLNYDAEVTVWNQGVFKLSSTTLNDLLAIITKSDFAIFVFNPDDISIIRTQTVSTTRDNVIFELGLFIGRLTPKNVFYVIPETESIHLPTDLLGINPGKYNSARSDNNLLAALGPFCNQVRKELKEFKLINLTDLSGESATAKEIALEQPFGFEYLLLAELIESRLTQTDALFKNLKNGIYFVRSSKITDTEYMNFFQETLQDFQRFINICTHLINEEIPNALGPAGVPSKFIDLVHVSEQIHNLSIELFNWETRNEQLIPPSGLEEVKVLLRGCSDIIGSQISKLPSEIRRVVKATQDHSSKKEDLHINLKLDVPVQMETALSVFQEYYSM